MVPTHPLSDSPRVNHRRARMVRGRYPEPVANQPVENGGQGRTDSRSESGQRSCPKGEDRRRPIRVNRTIDTRIFSSSESPVRGQKAEDAERIFAGPTELPRPTEPIPTPRRRNSSYELFEKRTNVTGHLAEVEHLLELGTPLTFPLSISRKLAMTVACLDIV